jgi:hypothetical protein
LTQFYLRFLGFETQLEDTSMTGETIDSDGQGSTSVMSVTMEYTEQLESRLLEIQKNGGEEGAMKDAERLE